MHSITSFIKLTYFMVFVSLPTIFALTILIIENFLQSTFYAYSVQPKVQATNKTITLKYPDQLILKEKNMKKNCNIY